MTARPVVHIIDDDCSARKALARLMLSAGFDSIPYSGVEEFLQTDFACRNACIVADVHMPGISALELPSRLKQCGKNVPVIFITADYSNETRERVRESGGHGYFNKPVDDQALVDMIEWTTQH